MAPQRGGVGGGRAGRAAGQRRDPSRAGGEAVRLVGRAGRGQGQWAEVRLPASKGKLLEAAHAALGSVEVVDQINFSRGAPPRFDSAASLLIDQIAKLKDGKITLSDNKVSLSGMARDLGGREAIMAALKNLPEGFSVTANDIKAPPYIFQAYKDPVAVTLTLTGYVPDNNVHATLAAGAARKFFNEKVVDNLKASIGAPSDSPLHWCRRSARCRGCRPARLWCRTAR